MTKTITPFTQIPSEQLSNSTAEYPYLVVRIMNAVYQRERIDIRQGEPAVLIGAGKCYVQHPEPRTVGNEISEGCRALLLAAVSTSVDKTKFRMSVVWGKSSTSYVERDGVINESSVIPSGGVELPNKLGFDAEAIKQPLEKTI